MKKIINSVFLAFKRIRLATLLFTLLCIILLPLNILTLLSKELHSTFWIMVLAANSILAFAYIFLCITKALQKDSENNSLRFLHNALLKEGVFLFLMTGLFFQITKCTSQIGSIFALGYVASGIFTHFKSYRKISKKLDKAVLPEEQELLRRKLRLIKVSAMLGIFFFGCLMILLKFGPIKLVD
jgi:hypothetical protein